LFVQTYLAKISFSAPVSPGPSQFLSFSAGEKIVVGRLSSKKGYGLTVPKGEKIAVLVLMEHLIL
jgi:hypothetical protein